jgi:hypothetical protein
MLVVRLCGPAAWTHPGSGCGLSRRFPSLDADCSDQPLCSFGGLRHPGRLGRTAVVERITAHREERPSRPRPSFWPGYSSSWPGGPPGSTFHGFDTHDVAIARRPWPGRREGPGHLRDRLGHRLARPLRPDSLPRHAARVGRPDRASAHARQATATWTSCSTSRWPRSPPNLARAVVAPTALLCGEVPQPDGQVLYGLWPAIPTGNRGTWSPSGDLTKELRAWQSRSEPWARFALRLHSTSRRRPGDTFLCRPRLRRALGRAVVPGDHGITGHGTGARKATATATRQPVGGREAQRAVTNRTTGERHPPGTRRAPQWLRPPVPDASSDACTSFDRRVTSDQHASCMPPGHVGPYALLAHIASLAELSYGIACFSPSCRVARFQTGDVSCLRSGEPGRCCSSG